MMVSVWSKIALAAGLVASASAQTYSTCNPMKKCKQSVVDYPFLPAADKLIWIIACAADPGLASSSYSVDFTKGADDDNWENTGHGEIKYTSEGAEFSINKQGDSPTIQSKWYMFFGRLEVHMKAAPGTGVVSSVVFLSDILDEM